MTEDGSLSCGKPLALSRGVNLRHSLQHAHRLQQLCYDRALGERPESPGSRRPPPPGRPQSADDTGPAAAPLARPARESRPKVVARAAADRRPIVAEFRAGRRAAGRGRNAVKDPVLSARRQKRDGRGAVLGRDDVAVEAHGRAGRGERLELVLAFVLGVHRQKSKNEEVHGGREDG